MNEKVKNILDNLLNLFESGDVPQALSIAVLSRPDVPCAKWSLSNRLLLFISNTSDARGFRQWSQVGRNVKKGSKAIYILSPRHRKMADKETDEEKVVLTGFAPVPVFRYEDTEGELFDQPDYIPTQMPPLFDVAQQWGLKVSWQGFQGDSYGAYRPGSKEIVLATHDEKVFFHELAHAAHEKVVGQLRGGQDWMQEIVAELSAAVLAHLYGKQTDDGGSYRYIKVYAERAGKDVYKACLSVVSEVGKVLELVMETDKKTEVSV